MSQLFLDALLVRWRLHGLGGRTVKVEAQAPCLSGKQRLSCAVHTKSGCAVAARASSDVLGREYSVFSLNSTLRRSAGLQ